MQVLLQQTIKKLGKKFSLKDVAPGYARNYLLPRGLAVLATPGAQEQVEKNKAEALNHESTTKENITAELAKLGEVSQLELTRPANEQGNLYAQIHEVDLVTALKEKGINLDEDTISITTPIKGVGSHNVSIVYGDETITKLAVTVSAETQTKTSA